MITMSIEPLRKTNIDGKLYTRLPEIETKLRGIHALPRGEISARCVIRDREDPNYLPSECLIYLVREHRTRPQDACSEWLYKTLLERVSSGLPSGESEDGERVRATASNAREELRYRFLEMLMRDRSEYVEGLDIFEIRFGMALAALRASAQRKVYSKDNPLETIEVDHETGEIAAEVEQAAGNFDPFDSTALDNSDYLLRLDQAIDGLPAMQKAVVVMIRNEIPIESKEPDVVNISKTLGKTPKTIRKYRDQAFASLQAALLKGEPR